LYLFLHAGSQLSFFGGQLAFSPLALLLDAEAFLDGLNELPKDPLQLN